MFLRRYKIRKHERGLKFVDGAFVGVLAEGTHWVLSFARKVQVDVLSVRDPWIRHRDLDVIVKSGVDVEGMLAVDLADDERAFVWVDGRLDAILQPGLYALWTAFRKVVVEVVDAHEPRLDRKDLPAILKHSDAARALERVVVDAGCVGLYFREGEYVATLKPGTYAFWRFGARAEVRHEDLREAAFDVAGQDIMTADKVTLRLNAVVTFKVADPVKATSTVDDFRQAIYREAQLALRAVVGTKSLDVLLTEKDEVAQTLENIVRDRARIFGVDVTALGIKDVILPGDMKDLMNRVTEAKKAAEAALITRREETAAARSQANTAKILEGSPTLMRLRELEVLEKVADKANLTVVLGEKGLADNVVKLL